MSGSYAIDTQYNGYSFRSRLEARWAVFFDRMNIAYSYEPEGFDLDGVHYLPDFFLSKGVKLYGQKERLTNIWVEIKPTTELEDDERRKIARFVQNTRNILLLLSGDPEPNAELRLISHAASGGEWSIPYVKWVELTDGEAGLLKLEDLEDVSDTDTRLAIERLTETEKLISAYGAARKARFEHGENPAEQPFSPSKICKSCGKLFVPREEYHPLCYECYLAEIAKKQSTETGLHSTSSKDNKKGNIPRWLYGLGALAVFLILLFIGFNTLTDSREPGHSVEPAESPATRKPALTEESLQVPAQGNEEINAGSQSEPGEDSVCKCTRNLYDCKDFETQTEAQACFDLCFESHGDIHWLDSNEDGKACETLP